MPDTASAKAGTGAALRGWRRYSSTNAQGVTDNLHMFPQQGRLSFEE